MEQKCFVYAWEIDPNESRLIGPFDGESDATQWAKDHADDYEQLGIVQMPFKEIGG